MDENTRSQFIDSVTKAVNSALDDYTCMLQSFGYIKNFNGSTTENITFRLSPKTGKCALGLSKPVNKIASPSNAGKATDSNAEKR